MTKVYLGGTFDLLHYGHLRLFQRCKDMYGDVWVSLNTDEFVQEYKGRTPVIPLNQRMALIESLDCVDHVVVNIGGADSKPAIEVVRPEIIIATGWPRKKLLKQMNLTESWLTKNGIHLETHLSYTDIISTTKIIERIKNEY